VRRQEHRLRRDAPAIQLATNLHYIECKKSFEHRTRPTFVHVLHIAVVPLDVAIEFRCGAQIAIDQLSGRGPPGEPVQWEMQKRVELRKDLAAHRHKLAPERLESSCNTLPPEIAVPISEELIHREHEVIERRDLIRLEKDMRGGGVLLERLGKRRLTRLDEAAPVLLVA